MHRFYVVGLVVLALAAAIALPASVSSSAGDEGIANSGPGTDVVSVCRFKAQKIDGITDDSTGKSTTSTTFVDIPNTAITVSIGGSANTCVKVEFSAYTFAATASTALLFVRVTQDGVACAPGEVQFSGDDDEDGDGRWARSHAFNYLCAVAPGAHTYKAQFRSFDGGSVFVHKTSLFVHHR